MINLPPKNSLRPLPYDSRDFNLGAVFPQVKLEEVPMTDFEVVQPLGIKDQGDSDYCSAYAVTAVSEDQEGVELIPEYQFYKTKHLSGNLEEWGADLRDACKSAVRFGSMALNGWKGHKGLTRQQILQPTQWPNFADSIALYHKKETYFAVNGKHDVFDNIRIALWQHRAGKSTIVTGALWRTEWLYASGGIIPKQYGDEGFGHAFKIYGQKVIKGEIYLKAQLSQGTGFGDNGIFYLPRKVVNAEIGRYGIYMFKDISRKDAEYYLENKVSLKSSFIKQLWSVFIGLFRN